MITEHCALRLLERLITEDDVRSVLIGSSSCRLQADGRWKVEGEDCDGERLFLIVEWLEGVVVATAFRGDEDDYDEG